ncbi:MAG TPA: hypothetical protein VEN31_04785 [Candidatus Bathyarchaeia archaeon]|nr:hypothetical protein [Candidatus Bathyarchaeia archaeon]
MIATTATASKTGAEGAGRVWRIVLVVVAAQLAVIAFGMVFFSALGLASTGGGCGGGG